MRTFITILAVGTVFAGLAGCGSQNQSSTPSGTTTSTAPQPSPTKPSAPTASARGNFTLNPNINPNSVVGSRSH